MAISSPLVTTSRDNMVEPQSKKRRLESLGAKPSLGKQESFSEMLEQLEAEEDGSDDHIETSSAWPRPAAPRLDPVKDSVSE